MTTKISPDDEFARENFEAAMNQVLKLRNSLQTMTNTKRLNFIPEGTNEIKEAYNNAILRLIIDRNTDRNNISFDSWLSFAMYVMMDGIFWEWCEILRYHPEFYAYDWLMIGICELNPYILNPEPYIGVSNQNITKSNDGWYLWGDISHHFMPMNG
jgi:hypothetical protein